MLSSTIYEIAPRIYDRPYSSEDVTFKFQTLEDGEIGSIFLFHALQLAEIGLGIAKLDIIEIISGVVMTRETQGDEACFDGGLDHFLGSVFPITVSAVGVQVGLGGHGTILYID